MVEHYLDAPIVTIWRKRAAWLSCLFVAELFTFSALAHFQSAISQIIALSFFVPLCISTGGNSGSQAATLITRAMALRQVTAADWWRVIRHELVLGIALGLTLGAIGFVRGAMTPESTRSDTRPYEQKFEIHLYKGMQLQTQDERTVVVPVGAAHLPVTTLERAATITVPEGQTWRRLEAHGGADVVYEFPANSEIRFEAVNRWDLGLVIALPLLTFYANIMALIGGAVMCYFDLGITIPVFLRQLQEAVSVNTLMVGLIKAPVFAFVIALVGCYEGFQVERNAASVGLLTTRSVVEGIFLVIVMDAAFSVMFSVLGI